MLLFNFENIDGFDVNFLYIIAFISMISGILIVITKNPIVSVLYLILLFSSISCYLIFIGLTFIGISYLLVYVGAVSILFLFIVMLINVRISELQSNTSNSIALAIIVGILFNYSLFEVLPYDITILNNYNITLNIFYIFYLNNYLRNLDLNNDILFITSKIWDGNLGETSHITSIGNIMYTNYNVWLIIASFILLVAMVGAIVITMKQRN